MKSVKHFLTLSLALFLSIPAFAQSSNTTPTEDIPRIDYESSPKEYVISDIKVEGLRTLDEKLLISTTGLMVGDSILIPSEHLSLVAKGLWDQRAFADIDVKTDLQGDSVAITFIVKERARVYDWQFDGIKKSQTKDLLEKLNLRRGSELSDYLMGTSYALIKEYYREKGFRNATVDYRIESDSVVKNGVVVVFDIDPGKKQRIKEITIEGADNLNTKKMAKAMDNTKKKSLNFLADNKFKDDMFDDDLVLIENYMRSQGYRDGEVLADSLYQIDEKNIGVWMKVKEGIKYYYRDITWVGNSVYTTDHLANYVLGLHKGDTYDSEAMGARLGLPGKGEMGDISVASMYQDNGYLVFNIEPFETVVGKDSVDVEVRMIEGKQFRINQVDFDGNTRTNDHVIRRELETLPGDLYSQSLLIRTYQRLASMGQFDQQSFSTPQVIPNPQNQTVDIKYSLTEISNDQLELSLGWGGGMFIASVGVNFTNVSMRKFFDKTAWRPYPAGDNQTLGVRVQTNGSYYQAYSLSFVEPWLGGKRPTTFSLNTYYSRETNAYTWDVNPTQYFGTIGVGASIGKRLRWPDPFFTFQVGLQYQAYMMDDWTGFLMSNGTANTLSLNLTFGRNSVDDLQGYPTTGSNISLGVSLTPPFSAFNDIDYSDQTLDEQTRYRWIEYHKWNFNSQWFMPLSPDRKLVLMARAQFGYLGSYDPDNISPFEGFNVGGDGLTTGYNVYGVQTVGLRGYSNGSLTPYSDYGLYANIYSKFTAEIRYPVIRQGSTMVYLLAFAEAGNAFTNTKDYKPFELKKSAGIGMRIYLPILGLLGIDWGYGFDPASPNESERSGSQFHFTMGMQM